MAKKQLKTEAVVENTAPASTPETIPVPKEPKMKHNRKLEIIGSHTDDSVIIWHVTSNPRMPGRGTFDRFQKYLGAATVGEYKKAGGTLGDLNWDLRAGYLSIEGVTLGGEVEQRKPRGRKPKSEKAAEAKAPVAVEEESVEEVIE